MNNEFENVTDENGELLPEAKIHMSLDEIIKHSNSKAGISANFQFKSYVKPFRRPNRRYRRKPFFYRHKRSENWRLRGNGPNTNRMRVKSFLEHKWRSAPFGSIWHRLGWHPVAQKKLSDAIHYRKYRSALIKNGTYSSGEQGSNRLKKLIASSRIYRLDNGLNNIEAVGPVHTLNRVNLDKLSEALGGQITHIKEQTCNTGTVITTITRVPVLSNVAGGHAFENTNQHMGSYMPMLMKDRISSQPLGIRNTSSCLMGIGNSNQAYQMGIGEGNQNYQMGIGGGNQNYQMGTISQYGAHVNNPSMNGLYPSNSIVRTNTNGIHHQDQLINPDLQQEIRTLQLQNRNGPPPLMSGFMSHQVNRPDTPPPLVDGNGIIQGSSEFGNYRNFSRTDANFQNRQQFGMLNNTGMRLG